VSASDNFAEVQQGGRVVIVVRCGGGNGSCGRVRALVLDDRSVYYAPIDCHRLPDLLTRDEVAHAFREASWRHERARRYGRTFRAPTVVVRPLPHRVRLDREAIQARDWERFEHAPERE
jgi:hypothetical protein